MKRLLFILFVFVAFHIGAQENTLGTWITVDDDGKTKKSKVELIQKSNGKLYGKITYLYDASKRGKKCEKCTDDRKNQPLIGLEIIRDMTWDSKNKEWSGGTITDPENGKSYKSKAWIEDGKLKVRGYVSIFYRTQTWLRP